MTFTKALAKGRLKPIPGSKWGRGQCFNCNSWTKPVLMHWWTAPLGQHHNLALCGECALHLRNMDKPGRVG